jgi:hypothetical protein
MIRAEASPAACGTTWHTLLCKAGRFIEVIHRQPAELFGELAALDPFLGTFRNINTPVATLRPPHHHPGGINDYPFRFIRR